MQVSTMIAVVAVSAVCLTAAKLWRDWCKHQERKRLSEERERLIRERERLGDEIDRAIDEEPDTVALHLRLRGEFERVLEQLRKLG